MRKKILIASLLFIVSNILFAFAVNLDPSRVQVSLKQASSVRKNLTLSNTGKEKLVVKVYLNDWTLKEGKKEFVPAGSTSYTLKNSCRIYPTSFTLQPNESKTVIVTLLADKSEVNSQYGVVFFEAFGANKPNQSGVQVGGRIGTIVYKDIEGKSKISYVLKDFKAAVDGNILSIGYSLSNNGNILLQPKGTILLVNKSNEVLFSEPLADSSVLPANNLEKKQSFPLGKKLDLTQKITAILTLDFGDDNIMVKEYAVN